MGPPVDERGLQSRSERVPVGLGEFTHGVCAEGRRAWQVARLVGPRGGGFDSPSGHMRRLQV